MGCECKKGAPAYMMTFGDLMSLLLTFFVLLISMATFEPTKFAMTTQSLQGAFGVLETFPTVLVLPIVNIPKFSKNDARRQIAAQEVQQMQEKLKKKDMEDGVKVKVTETGIAVLLSDPVSFASGSDELNPKSLEVIREVGKILDRQPQAQVRVEGHTDDVPIRSGKFASNWELSSARALRIVKALSVNSSIHPGRLSAVGYGEHRPLVPNVNSTSRQKNRRIEIYIDYTQKQEKGK